MHRWYGVDALWINKKTKTKKNGNSKPIFQMAGTVDCYYWDYKTEWTSIISALFDSDCTVQWICASVHYK